MSNEQFVVKVVCTLGYGILGYCTIVSVGYGLYSSLQLGYGILGLWYYWVMGYIVVCSVVGICLCHMLFSTPWNIFLYT